MAEKKSNASRSGGGVTIQLNLIGLIIFSAALVAAAALVTYGMGAGRSKKIGEKTDLPIAIQTNDENYVVESPTQPPSGQLNTREINLEQPEEYVAYETATNHVETWTFEGMTPEQVRMLMQSCGVA